MVALNPPVCNFGWLAPDFSLPGVDGKVYTLDSTRGPNGLLLMFLCNHCPYVKAVLNTLIEDARKLEAFGIGSVAIMSNDVDAYPEDSFENMVILHKEANFGFPYLYDAEQTVAQAYGAVCTPDFFGFNSKLELQYRGRIHAYGAKPPPGDKARELFEGMRMVAETGHGPSEQIASIGCSIKWKK